MSKKLIIKLVAVAIAAAVFTVNHGRAAEPSFGKIPQGRVLIVPAPKIPAVNGKQMYGSYCATCHGINGRGDGPVGSELRVHPTDLTALSRNHQGKFPYAHVSSVIDAGLDAPAHGAAMMPVWGPVLGKMDPANPAQRQLRISNLSRYLESIQSK
jgi:mono/diheme cytochrome c family protein